MNSVYLAKLSDQSSTSAIRVFAKCFSSSDKSRCGAISIIWRTTFHERVKVICPQRGLISWQVGLILKSLFSSYPSTQSPREKKENTFGWECVSKAPGNLRNVFATEKRMPLSAFVRPAGSQANSLLVAHMAQLHKQFPPLSVQSSARSLLPRYLQLCKQLPAGCVFPTVQLSISTLKELTRLHQIISLQVSAPWKQIGPKGRHILIMRERLRGGKKRSQHEA